MKVLVVDDHPLVRRGLSSTLAMEENVESVGEASCIEEAIYRLTQELYGVAFVDLKLGAEDGLDVVRIARKKNLQTKIVILTSSIRKDDFFRAQEANVDGYILKGAYAEDILYAFRVIARGKKYFDPELMEYGKNKADGERMDLLTPREREILIELGKGLSNQEIARNLYITENTVKKHVSSILIKLEVGHRTQAALLVNETGLYSISS